jgi:hypothetical protein
MKKYSYGGHFPKLASLRGTALGATWLAQNGRARHWNSNIRPRKYRPRHRQ